MFDFLKKHKYVADKNNIDITLITSEGRVLIFSVNEVTVGRESGQCDFVVENTNVSKKHMHFILSDGRWFAEDLNSTNGTWINGERLAPMKPVPLSPGDRICIALSDVFYFMEKPTEDKYIEDVEYEKKVGEIESIIKSIKEQGGNLLESEYAGRMIDLLCETSLYVKATFDEQMDNFQVMLIKPANEEIVPIFTRWQYADAFGKQENIVKLKPEKLMLTLNQLGEHIVINPNCENKLIIPKDIFKMVIFEEFMKKFKAKAGFEKYKGNNDILGALVCQYNMASHQFNKMQLISAILEYMSENVAWVPCNANYSEEDYEKIKNLKKGDVFSFENTRLKPDILKHASGQMFFPIFSQKEEAPEDYAKNFSWINMPIVQCCMLAKNSSNCSGIIVNAFTNSLPITNELVEIVLNRYYSKSKR